MPLWLWFVDSLAVLAILAILVLIAVVIRRRYLERTAGAFEMSINRHEAPGPRGWILGVAVYGATEVEWYRTFSLSWRPRHRFPRGEVAIEGRRQPQGAEAFTLHPGQVVATCTTSSGVRQLAMSPTSLTGLLAWLESSPPGRGVNKVV
ncbi:hypothetical protein HMPREF0063_12235 [Aeromicrobium marinum DSM 15272]|uniref:DUF2550 domain-containing protein n=1 Tax=Aeromicrobium marinum DSM 15272 TaxID=585531 RepID=E2SCS3_9ACTN|nr:DUF2550 domain-containing protein [Aeromicrobium marinum]EFQ83026.1 hypothetical protein HMPREF0063_12235 [Aeromicrobium marinum DSM 15272]